MKTRKSMKNVPLPLRLILHTLFDKRDISGTTFAEVSLEKQKKENYLYIGNTSEYAPYKNPRKMTKVSPLVVL